MKNLFEELQPLEPVSTNETFLINISRDTFSSVKVVIFDVYGTLLISDSGDIGGVYHGAKHAALVLKNKDIEMLEPYNREDIGRHAVNEYLAVIKGTHENLKSKGIEHPEVDIVEVWKGVLHNLQNNKYLKFNPDIEVKYIATHFEFLNNPTYPMPGMMEVLETLKTRGYNLGVISNAQFFTPCLLKFFMGESTYLNGIDPPLFDKALTIYSYLEGMAKPGKEMYVKMADRLAQQNIKPEEVIFVGNDMLNDIYPASQVGFKTALFAGDKRSLRLRVGHPKTEGLSPDMVVTDLKQLFEVLEGASSK